MSPSKFRNRSPTHSPDRYGVSFERGSPSREQRIHKNESLDFFRQQNKNYLGRFDDLKSRDHQAKSYQHNHFENINFKITNECSDLKEDHEYKSLIELDKKVKQQQNLFNDYTEDRTKLFDKVDDLQNMSQVQSDNTSLRRELYQYDFWIKQAAVECVGEDEYESKLQQLKLDYPNEQNSYLKADSWLKKTFEDNNKHGKFLIDDGEFDVDFDWLESCNQLIEDYDKGQVNA